MVTSSGGWRTIFYLGIAMNSAGVILSFLFYYPAKPSVGKVLVQVGPGPIGPDFWVQVLGFWQGPVWTQKVLAKFVARRKKRIFFRTCESRFISISYTKCLPILWKVSNLSPLHWLNCQHPLLLHPLPHPILVIYRIDCKFEGLMEFNGF